VVVPGQQHRPDILSLELLGVQLPPRVALGLLEGALREDAAFLERIPIPVPLWDERAGKLIELAGLADALWRLLKVMTGLAGYWQASSWQGSTPP
jgi:hypothetical protein